MEATSYWVFLLVFCFVSIITDCYSITKVKQQNSRSFCQIYQGSTCYQFLGDQNVYMKPPDSFSSKNEIVKAAIDNITVSSLKHHDTCKNYTSEYLCNVAFPLCDANSSYPVPRQICRDECEVLENKICKDEFFNLTQNPLFRNRKILPVCDELPPVGSKESDECMRIGIPDAVVDKESSCFKIFNQYRGAIDTTISGQKCQPWSLQSSYPTKKDPLLMGGHNYCRSPGVRQDHWCFTIPDIRKETCNIPRCGTDRDDGTPAIQQIQAVKITTNSIKLDIITSESVDSIEVKCKEYQEYVETKTVFIPGDIYEFEGLTPGGVYNFRIRATFKTNDQKNQIGSKPKNVTNWVSVYGVPLLPDKPEVIFHRLEGDRVKIEWIAQYKVDQYQLTYYTVQKMYKGWKHSTCPIIIDLATCAGFNYTIAGLSPKTYYKLQLRAHTAAGFGEAYKTKFYIP